MKKIRTILKPLFLILTTIVVATPVHAVLPSEDVIRMFDKNGIYYYNPSGNADDCLDSTTVLTGANTAEKIWNFFIEHGFTDAQAAGILGNAMVESGLVATRSRNGSYWGIFQWGGGRKEKLFKKLEKSGFTKYTKMGYWGTDAENKIPKDDYDGILNIELAFALEEKDRNWQEEIKQATIPELAAEIFLTLFERAVGGNSEIIYYSPFVGSYYQAAQARRKAAKEFYDKYTGNGTSPSSTANALVETGKNLTVIGDSITVGSRSAILEKFSDLSTSDINALSGRGWFGGIEVAKNMNLHNTVVFALGTNSPGLTQEQVIEAIDVIGHDRTIVFVTNYNANAKDLHLTNNNIFKNLAKQYSNIIIADWAQTVSQNPELYLKKDMLHPNSSGTTLFAETIWKAINSNTTANGCSVNGEFQSLVTSYAWPDYHPAPWHERMPAYADAVNRSISEGRYVGGSVAGVAGIDCGGFVTILVQNSGLEPNYNDSRGGTGVQESWVKNHGWQLINDTDGEGILPIDTSLLQPGDVAFSSGHTFIYVGDIPGFNSTIASASYSTTGAGRAPMAGAESLTFGNGTIVRWYRSPSFHPAATPSYSNLID